MNRLPAPTGPDLLSSPAWVLADELFHLTRDSAELSSLLRPDQLEVALALAGNFSGTVADLLEAALRLHP